ncbi:YheC/YheD family protein [Paenibacillus sp. 32352]|uniref:YheC/YheD family protein n=1 Tax=Paenibacillus sp. 32352 TaxID=1969111 RepID=UPI0009AEB3A1|nr:YheC/YheD family protein [Paenibacillus sp. 32352]
MWKIRFHRMFQKVPQLRKYLPETALCNEARLADYLDRYPAVYIKPDGGGRGKGVIKAWKKGNLIYYVKVKGDVQSVNSVKELFLKLKLNKPVHIVQQAIDLARINGRPFDIRVMMMRDRQERWNYIGMVAKVAGTKSIITNVARGKGYVLPIDRALRESLGLSGSRIAKKKNEMIQVAELCTRTHSKSRYDWQIGYDIAIDRKGKVWFIETNPAVPAHNLFRSEPSVYRTMKQLAAFHKRKQKHV